MRIGIDARLWNETGVGRYIRNLISELHKIDKQNHYVLFVTPKAIRERSFDFAQDDNRWKIVVTDIPWHTLEEQMLFYKVLENEILDLMHFPYFSIPVLYNRPYVITIHDLIINHFPTGKASTLPSPVYHAKRFAYKFILKQTAKKAKTVIAVSEATRKEIIEHLPVSEDKIVVTYEGIDKNIKTDSGQVRMTRFGLSSSDKYFLYVGNAYPHKNVERLLESFQLLLENSPDAKLVLVGKKNYFYQQVAIKTGKLQLQKNVIFTDSVTDQELGSLYKNAQALVFPSLMEGFGLPGLEAMQKGCLVLASDIPVFKEIYQNTAVYFNPLDIHEMNDTMQKVLKNKEKYKSFQVKGQKLAEQFSWEKMAKETLKVYESSVSI